MCACILRTGVQIVLGGLAVHVGGTESDDLSGLMSNHGDMPGVSLRLVGLEGLDSNPPDTAWGLSAAACSIGVASVARHCKSKAVLNVDSSHVDSKIETLIAIDLLMGGCCCNC